MGPAPPPVEPPNAIDAPVQRRHQPIDTVFCFHRRQHADSSPQVGPIVAVLGAAASDEMISSRFFNFVALSTLAITAPTERPFMGLWIFGEDISQNRSHPQGPESYSRR